MNRENTLEDHEELVLQFNYRGLMSEQLQSGNWWEAFHFVARGHTKAGGKLPVQ